MARNLHYVELTSDDILIVDLDDCHLYFHDNRLCLHTVPFTKPPDQMPGPEDLIRLYGAKVKKSDFPVSLFEDEFGEYDLRSKDIVSIAPYKMSPDGYFIL